MKTPGWIKGILALTLLAAACGPVAPVRGQGTWLVNLPLVTKPARMLCRFGVTTRSDITGYADTAHLNQLRPGILIDWGNKRPDSLASDIAYVHIIGTGVHYQPDMSLVANMVKKNPGGIWQVGNEPDTCYSQDCATPEQYGQQYYNIATTIRANDQLARMAFGSIVQPTKIRMQYLDLAWAKLVELAGGSTQASALVDIWSIHAFILNETPGGWGTGVPPGMTYNPLDLFIIDLDSPDWTNEVKKTYDINILMANIRAFRAWMAAKGERAKPLWISEYGSAFPPIDKPAPDPRDVYNVSDADTAAYLVSSFDFFRTATNAATGMPGDNNLLVQRWFWYTMNDNRWKFGGVLFDPDSGQSTLVGQAYINYVAPLAADTSCAP